MILIHSNWIKDRNWFHYNQNMMEFRSKLRSSTGIHCWISNRTEIDQLGFRIVHYSIRTSNRISLVDILSRFWDSNVFTRSPTFGWRYDGRRRKFERHFDRRWSVDVRMPSSGGRCWTADCFVDTFHCGCQNSAIQNKAKIKPLYVLSEDDLLN